MDISRLVTSVSSSLEFALGDLEFAYIRLRSCAGMFLFSG